MILLVFLLSSAYHVYQIHSDKSTTSLTANEAANLAYASLSEHDRERLRLLGPVEIDITEYRATEKHVVVAKVPGGKLVDIRGLDTYRIEFRTPRDMTQLGVTTAYIDRRTRKFIGCDILF